MTDTRAHKRTWLKRLSLLVILLILVGAGIYLKLSFQQSDLSVIPSVEVEQGEFVDYIELRGEVTVGSSNVIRAPSNAGDLQLLKLVSTGTTVQKGDVIASFDPTNVERNIDQFQAALKQAEAEIERLHAQQRLKEEQTKTDVVSAEFNLEVARLDASAQEVLPEIENEKNRLAVAKAEQRMQELEARLDSDRVAAEADLAGALRRRDKAIADLEKAQHNLTELVLRSPGDGIIALLTNSRANTSLIGTSPVFKEGDRIWSGATIAELPDMTTIHAIALVYESDRGRVEIGQPVLMRIEAVPDRDHEGIVSEISPLARIDSSSYPVRKSFDLKVQMGQPDPRLRAGMTATVRVEVERIPNAVIIPVESVFERGGRLVVYVLEKDRYLEREVRLARRGESQIMIASGLEPGERIATKDPTLAEISE